jgi:hypothetical protein
VFLVQWLVMPASHATTAGLVSFNGSCPTLACNISVASAWLQVLTVAGEQELFPLIYQVARWRSLAAGVGC